MRAPRVPVDAVRRSGAVLLAASLTAAAAVVVAAPATAAVDPSSGGAATGPASVVAGTSGVVPSGAAQAAGCPGQAVPPGPPADEETVPVAPLPVPAEPVGGPGMGACGDVRAPGTPPPPPVGLASYVVADLDTGAVLAARAPHARHRPASTLKVLLSLEVVDRLAPTTVVVGTPEDANIDGSRAGLGPGGRYTVDQLFHGLILNSGNDAANALARTLGGVPATLEDMGRRARELGALDTRPASVSGLDGPGMSSSAYDLALIFRAAAARPWVTSVMRTRTYPFPGFADRPGFLISNENPLVDDPGEIGGKTGFTDAARHTFVGAVDRGGRRLVVALVRGEQRPVRMVDQARALLDWGFATPRTTAPVGELVEPARAPAAAAPSDVAGPGDTGTGSSEPPPVSIVLAAVAALTVLVLLVARRRRP